MPQETESAVREETPAPEEYSEISIRGKWDEGFALGSARKATALRMSSRRSGEDMSAMHERVNPNHTHNSYKVNPNPT